MAAGGLSARDRLNIPHYGNLLNNNAPPRREPPSRLTRIKRAIQPVCILGVVSHICILAGLLFFCFSCDGKTVSVRCLFEAADRYYSVAFLLTLTVMFYGMHLFNFLFKSIYLRSSIRLGYYKKYFMLLMCFVNSMVIVISFEYKKRHQFIFAFIVIGIQSIAHAMIDIFMNKNEFLEDNSVIINSTTPIALTIAVMSLYLSNIFIFIYFENFIVSPHLINFTIIVSLNLMSLAFLSTMLETSEFNCYSTKCGLYVKLFSPIVLDILFWIPKILASLYLISENMKLNQFRKYFGVTFFLFRLVANFVIIISKIYHFCYTVYYIFKAEKRFMWASRNELKNYDRPCSICWENIENGRILECKHIFHDSCIKRWLLVGKTCPICRTKCLNSTQSSMPSGPVFQINLTHWIPSLPVIEIYRNQLPNIDQIADLGEAVTNPRSVAQVYEMFPDLSRDMIARSVSLVGVHRTITRILDNPELFRVQEEEVEEIEEEEPITNENEAINSVAVNKGFSITNEEYNNLLSLDPNDYKEAFSSNNESIRNLPLQAQYKLMLEYSRKQYLLKNCLNPQNQIEN